MKGRHGDFSENFLAQVSAMMRDAWTEPGFCVPNNTVYPHQWLWDSCFHAVIWARLDPDRGVQEIENSLAKIGPTGFVPHMTYWSTPTAGEQYWGRPETSSITQPPMWGLAITELELAGASVPTDLKEAAAQAILHVCRHRPPTPSGLVPAYHPWETGCDDTPRWDSWATDNNPIAFDRPRWMKDKRRFLDALVFDESGAPIDNPKFAVGSIGHNTLIAWNARLLADSMALTSADAASVAELRHEADRLTDAIRGRWRVDLGTWVDEPVEGGARPSCQARTADTLLASLIDPQMAAFDQLLDRDAFGGMFGPSGVHRQEPTYGPDRYWRGSNWPQINYLLYRAAADAHERGDVNAELPEALADGLVAGARQSALSEYWHPDTGTGYGACPQTWAGLAICV